MIVGNILELEVAMRIQSGGPIDLDEASPSRVRRLLRGAMEGVDSDERIAAGMSSERRVTGSATCRRMESGTDRAAVAGRIPG